MKLDTPLYYHTIFAMVDISCPTDRDRKTGFLNAQRHGCLSIPTSTVGRVSEIEQGVKIERLPSIAYPPENLHLFFKITDSDGLYHVRFLHLHTMMHSCKTLSGKQATVKFDTATVEGSKRVNVQTVDRNGNARYSGWFSFGDIEPTLILDISGGVTDVPDNNYTSIRGPWLWMIAPTEENKGGKDSTHIDSLAVVSANTVNEETTSKYGGK